jgi:predicted O-linked N-acetylglucosamine transferase (SPINDLY family)
MCKVDKNDIEAWISLVKINAQLGRPAKVEACCREIIRIDPNSHEAHFHLGSALLFQDKRSDAIAVFQSALRLNPDHAPTHFAIGILTDSLDTALDHFTRAAHLDPSHVEANRGVACALVAFGQIEEAVSRMQACLNRSPTDHKIRSNLLFSLNYSPVCDPASVYSEHARWGQLHSLATSFRHHNTPDPERRLRVGYVSPDLCEHSVAYFLEPLLANLSCEAIETFCYAEVARPDATTRRLQSLSAHWHSTCGIGDRELGERIHADRIDILVDLAGHTVNNRLRVFSAKPAPVQVTYLGYPNTTGLTAMDYRLTDVHADPPGQAEDYHTETLFRLPHGFLCYQAPANAPPVAPSPVGTRGHFTYGSFNNLSKLTPAGVALWADLLHTTPNARLVLKSNALASAYARERYLKLFAEHGIGPEHIELRKRDPTVAEHLNSYCDIDIALDTFPYHGTATTCEALFMSVPVVTMAGQTHASRVGASLLNQIGATDLIASTPDDYVRIASRLAQDRDELAQRRTTLRGQMAASPLCDAKRFAVDVESACRDMWRRWCLNRSV